jgi:ornithine carbamoyltransferase
VTPKRDFLDLADAGANGLRRLIGRAGEIKALRGRPEHPRPLAGKTVLLLFEKASTRTRISFEVGIAELGGQAIFVSARDSQLGRGEPIADAARVLSRYVHAAVLRTHAHDTLVSFARNASVPVVNGLTDRSHPCQVLADLFTVAERNHDWAGLTYAWVGDGFNMAASWIEAAGLLSLRLRLACPPGHRPDPAIVAAARSAGGRVEVVDDPAVAVQGADVVSTDVWSSMGHEAEADARRAAFSGFTVDEALMARARPDAIFLHCLPAHRGEEVTGGVIDGPRSAVWDEAENRLHAQKALLEWLMP